MSGFFLLQFKCPKHLSTASLQMTPPSTHQEAPEGTRSATVEILGVRPPLVSLNGCGHLSLRPALQNGCAGFG